MIFYENQTITGLIIASLPAVVSLYLFYVREQKKAAMACLLLSALLLRLLMISLDPYVQEWDERFHALVAKNMMDHPFKPMMFAHPVLPYQISDWSYNHIWVHKQPLFLWQMALSMKIFGVSTFAMRLPSAVLGTVMVWMIYDLGKRWIKNDQAAFMAAFLSAFAFYTLELTSGWFSLEHNDLIFTVYMTATFWAFTRYVDSDFKLKWGLLVGVFAGFAILNKWLVGLLIYGGWGLYLLMSEYRFDLKKYGHLMLAMILTCVVFLPWQYYILKEFPAETAAAYASNRKHITEDLGHPGSAWSHILFLTTAYHFVLLLFLIIGLVRLVNSKTVNRWMTYSFLAMIVVIFLFFSLFVATRMPAFVYPVSSLIFVFMGYGIYSVGEGWSRNWNLIERNKNQLLVLLTLITAYLSLKPERIANHRSIQNEWRNVKLHNLSIMKNLDDQVLKDHIILNSKSWENIELMFYKNTTAYHWYPLPGTVDSLQNLGYKLAAFHYATQTLPDYMLNDPEILILQEDFK